MDVLHIAFQAELKIISFVKTFEDPVFNFIVVLGLRCAV